jgi:hypothetical protein
MTGVDKLVFCTCTVKLLMPTVEAVCRKDAEMVLAIREV